MKPVSLPKLTALLIMMILIFTTTTVPTFASTPLQMKTTDNLSLRTAPSTSATRITVIPVGTVVTASAQEGAWYKVTYSGKTGWSHGDYLRVVPVSAPAPAPAPATTTAVNMQATTSLSLRTGPSTSYSRLLVIPAGGQVVATETSGLWKKVNYKGTVGWSHSAYLKTVAQVVASTVQTAPPSTPSTSTSTGYAISYAAANQGQKEIFTQTNTYRASVGKSNLTYSAGLSAVAQSWAKKMASTNTIAHSPTGDVFGNWQATGENVALFYETVGGAKLVEAWKNSSGHKFNLDYAYTHIGVGYYVDGNGYTWAVQIFAKYSYGIGTDVAPWVY